MAEADPKAYLLSIASYADGTTSLVIDWFDGASLVTATSSLNVLGSDLTNAQQEVKYQAFVWFEESPRYSSKLQIINTLT